MNTNRRTNLRLPGFLTLPFGLVPSIVQSTALVSALNRIFAEALREGELDFMQGRGVGIHVEDARLNVCLSLAGRRLLACTERHQPCDLRIEGTAYDFLLLATRREDPDTLFFNRRLRLNGDTELGLYVKNFLDSLEPEEQLGSLFGLLEKAVYAFERFPQIVRNKAI
ncbi:MAG: sterol-binding protein [Gammaproteobacteria bacterium]|nr:sterol-binding protein [Gammaproteobacteria bacterium]